MDKSIKKVRAHLLIFGRVQGVAFRYYTQGTRRHDTPCLYTDPVLIL